MKSRGRVEADAVGVLDDPMICSSAEPRNDIERHLTVKEVDAMRTARAYSVGVAALAERYRVHRGTVWAKTRLA